MKSWINIFLYQIRNNKLFTALNVLGLSIGIAGLIFALLYWNDEQSYDVWNPEKDNVYQVVQKSGDAFISSSPAPLGQILKTKTTNVIDFCYFNNGYTKGLLERKGKKQIIEKIIDAQSNFFSFFPFEFIKGNANSAILDNSSMAISEETAKLLFGTENPIGQQLKYENNVYQVRGVYQMNGKSSVAPNMVINTVNSALQNNKNEWNWSSFSLLLKLKATSDTNSVLKQISSLFFENQTKNYAKSEGLSPLQYEKKHGKDTYKLEVLNKARLHSVIGQYPEERGNYSNLLTMMGLSILILVLSIINYINLATATAMKRAKEVGVRRISGASKMNIICQFIFETVLLVSFSILFALVIVELSLPFYNDFLDKTLKIYESLFYIQLIALFFAIVIFAGVFPAIYVANYEIAKVLKGVLDKGKKGEWIRNSMLVFQFAIASFFITGFYIVTQQMDYVQNKDLGFKGEQVVNIEFNFPDSIHSIDSYNKYQIIKQELLKINGVTNVSSGNVQFGEGRTNMNVLEYNKHSVMPMVFSIDYNFLDVMEIQMVKGRQLDSKLSIDSTSSVIVNEKMVELMKENNPLGKQLDFNKKVTIVGVTKNFNLLGLQSKYGPMVIHHFKVFPWTTGVNNVFIKIAPQNMTQTIANIEKFWTKKVDLNYPFKYDFVDKQYARTYETYVKQKNLFSLLNIVVILIALFGLFALASYSIQRRMKEIAIRKTLGAETNILLGELSKQYILYCIIGFLLALFPVYYLLNKWLENFAFRIDINIFPFVLGFIILLVLTLIIVLSRAYQATKTDVLKYLKYE
jgi:putative ABC transport system permease protein